MKKLHRRQSLYKRLHDLIQLSEIVQNLVGPKKIRKTIKANLEQQPCKLVNSKGRDLLHICNLDGSL